jgi:DNA processing protein
MRNRIIAGLVRMVVIVESHLSGGSLITAEKAMDRGIDVRAVPGPVHSPASAGTNQLLYDGPGPVRDATDVLDSLGLIRPRTRSQSSLSPSHELLDPASRRAMDAVDWTPTSFNRIVERAGIPVAEAARRLDDLERAGLVANRGGWWVRLRPA